MNDGWDSLREALGMDESDSIRGEKALKEATVYTCVKILSETLGKLPLKVYRYTEGGQQQVNHSIAPILKLRMNRYMSAITGWKCLEAQRTLYGNAYAWISASKKNGAIEGIYPLDSRRVSIYMDDVGLLSGNRMIWYYYTDNDGTPYWFRQDEILHFKGLSTDGIVGLSVIEALRASVENAKASGTFLNTSYKKGMMASGVLQYTGDLDTEKSNKIRNQFEKMTMGIVNANRIAVMPMGMRFEPFQMKLTDAQFLENSRFTVQQLTAAFGVKPHQVNDLTKASYASVSESNREFYTDTMMAILAEYEQEINYKCFLPSEIKAGYYAKFNADAITRAEIEKRMTMYKDAIQNGVMTPNECRQKEDLPPREGGDELFGNSALAPVKLLAQGMAMKGGNAIGDT
ncbi:phage portal protein [Anaeromassilibacillus senegalensis]|uniref:phage portal protein n=1 Tax=Anaeromassilibacillus senegalensis TaxID=1673717 RepID=UPI0018A85E39|nr:phage portal protein [Anaeromassilibacillus senegalensis]